MLRIKQLRSLVCSAVLGIAVALAGCGGADANREIISNAAAQAQVELIDLNAATEAELTRLPGIGEGLAKRIVEHRRRYGSFRKPEHLMMVEGISDARFRRVRHLIKTN